MRWRKSGNISGAPREIDNRNFRRGEPIDNAVAGSRVIISFRFGPAFTWQCVQVRLHNLPTLICRISGFARRSCKAPSASFEAKRLVARRSLGTRNYEPVAHRARSEKSAGAFGV